jgi:glyoxylase-like metal-dependent hydrolase (beta-lactamase superfamily II)
MHDLKVLLTAALLAGASGVVFAQAPAPPDWDRIEIRTTQVAPGLHALEGQGGTVSVLVGKDGALVIDSQFAPLGDKLVAAVRKLTSGPIRLLVNTHIHGDHTGGNASFQRQGAMIVARDEVRQRMLRPTVPPGAAAPNPAVVEALPVVTYGGPVTLHLNGQEIRLIPMPAGHTDGDTMIEFPGLDVLVVGDFFRTVGYPVADVNSGGSFRGIAEELGVAIGRAGARTRVVPGHGPASDRAGLIAQRDVLLAVRARVEELVAQGQTLEQVLAARPTAPHDAAVTQGAQSSERFIRGLYAEISALK